ncbi:endothelin-converting enzyme, metalloendopeptidase [Rhodotorula toruloides]|uniref:Endothelin-converting enzyme, metalloendopeptidase n=1 Tax=Rhodotorula toruloides TaxID=5286 RepID=A0A511KM55_RHOTO|nr:endothelin-converting enzyme, metalloendopeptidase [Rhodotorula toruloides]
MSDLLPEKNAEYGTQKYWDERYSREADDASFDWCKSYRDIRHLVHRFIPRKDARIVMLGCGNSTLSRDMYDDGYKNITNVDYSTVVIEKMRRINEGCEGMTWTVGDVRSLPFEDRSVDVCFDKATLDAMLTSEKDPWNPPPEAVAAVRGEIDEVIRVLKPSGTFLYLFVPVPSLLVFTVGALMNGFEDSTFGQPHFRKPLLRREGWTVEYEEVGDGFAYYWFWMRRKDVHM